MARHSDKPVKTYSVAFSEGGCRRVGHRREGGDGNSERNTPSRGREIGPDALQELIGSLDEPFCDPALVPLYALVAPDQRARESGAVRRRRRRDLRRLREVSDGQTRSRRLPLSSLVHEVAERLPWRPRGAWASSMAAR